VHSSSILKENGMSLSRRRFLGQSSIAATALPFLLSLDTDYCEAATGTSFDLAMGFPEGAVRLNWNENTLGPSPKAIEGAKVGLLDTNRYALGGLLTPLVAEYHDIDEDWILMGTGSTELQRLAPISHLRDGGNVVSSLETWGGGLSVAEAMGAGVKRLKLVKEEGYAFDIKGMLDAVDSDTRIFLVVTPNNPTGTSLSYAEIEAIVDALPKDVLFVLDEAYADYHPEGWKTGIDLLKAGHHNVLVTRTFSKAQALAGLRCGYGLGHPDILKKIQRFGCGPGSTNIVAFGAVQGALSDPAHAKRSRAYVQKTRAYYQRQAQALGLDTVSGPSPFILIEFGDRVKAINSELRKRKIIVSDGESWNLPRYLRVSYGREEENQAFFRELTAIL
jgi:histidinol-phosphate aminotransferase